MKYKKDGRILALTVVGLVVAVSISSTGLAETVSTTLENALYTEQTVGDPVAALGLYKKVIAHPEATEAQKAQAQFRMGMCLMKQRKTKEAREAFRLVVKVYPNQKDLVAEAELRLGRLTQPNPAMLMPPDILVYMEIGDPGRQVETIVNMLKGTPLENPLMILGGKPVKRPVTTPAGRTQPQKSTTTQPTTKQPRRNGPGQKTSADIIAALLNPSMLKEFKKIRGMAIGLSDLDIGGGAVDVSLVAVLYPGESDALRGLLLAGLLMVGQEAPPIEGLQTIDITQIGNNLCAYDDNVMIFASSRDQLTWCVKQYKGERQPSLATANPSFSKLTDPQNRQVDALTIWADPARIFEKLERQFEQGEGGKSKRSGMPKELRAFREFIDVENITGVAARVVIDEKDPFVEAMVIFKDDHRCLAYDLFRTPHLSRAGFEAVPAEAVCLLSIALGEASGENGEQTEAARKAIRHLTGLDVGREIFANIEQVNVLALASGQETANHPLAKATNPIVPRMAVALTSRDPRQTREVLDRLLSIPKMVMYVTSGVSGKATATTQPLKQGQYPLFSMGPGKEGYCYVGQAGRSTVIALDEQVLQTCLQAATTGNNVLKSGLLQPQMSHLPPRVSKLLLINAGAAVQAVMSHVAGAKTSPATPAQPTSNKGTLPMHPLAEALGDTDVVLYTIEDPNRLTLRFGIRNLPPLGELFPLIANMMGRKTSVSMSGSVGKASVSAELKPNP